jgi:hypothetical protein
MFCVFCGEPAERACTRCGHFFCVLHGGDRLVGECAGEDYCVVTRGLCDRCTPHQGWMAVQQAIQRTMGVLGFAAMLIFVLMVSSYFMKY